MKQTDLLKRHFDSGRSLTVQAEFIKALLEEKKTYESENESLRLRVKEMGKIVSQLHTQIADLSKSLAEEREKLREQTEADLLLTAQRIQQKILKGDSIAVEKRREFSILQSQYNARNLLWR